MTNMGKEHQKRVLAALMAASIAIPTPVLAASPADFSDFPKNWAENSLSYAVSNGLLSGDSGKIRPSETLKRAEMAAILNRLAGAAEGAPLTGYTDVPTTAWYYGDMAKAVQMGTFKGDGGKLRPEAPITRQEVFAALARFYCLEQADTESLGQYADSGQIAPWARGAVAAMAKAGYIHGNDGKINPLAPITRAEFSQVIYNLAGNIAEEGKPLDAHVEGNLVVRKDNTSLDNVTVKGDLIIADGAQNVKLDNVNVEGRILIRGGGENVKISKSNAQKGVLAANPTQTANITAKDSRLGAVTLWSDTKLSGEFEKVEIPKTLSLTLENGKIDAVQVHDGAENAKIQVEKDGTVSKVEANAKGTQVNGTGIVGEVYAGSDKVQVATENTKVTTGENVSDVQAGGKEVQPKTTVTTDQKTEKKSEETPSKKKKHSSGSHSSSSRQGEVHMVSDWKGFKEAVENAKEGDTIRLQEDITAADAQGISIQTKGLTVDGNRHTIRSGDHGALSFLVDGKDGAATGIEIKDFVLEGASFPANKNGVFTVKDGAEITFRNVTVKGAKAQNAGNADGGSALYIYDGGKSPVVNIIGCTFEDNGVQAGDHKAAGRGGAVYINNQKSSSAVKVTVRDTAFRNNSAAYGGALAADGVVELGVTGSAFTGNTGAAAADDMYLFDGAVKGKEDLDITSAVKADLQNNTYSNAKDSKDDMTAMNVIFGRYYPESFSGTKGTAPKDAVDLLFADGERTKKKEEKHSGTLADGVWYGTGTESLYYDAKGPDIVRVVIKNGKVSAAYSEKHIEDESFERGQNVLNHVKNMTSAEDVDKLAEQLRQKKGTAYDAISGATETAKGHLSALKNAIQRAEKYSADQVKQNVQWFDFEKKPKANMNFGEKLDLTGTVLKVHLASGETKSVPFDKFSAYGITTNIANGTVITKETPGVNEYGALQIQFKQEDGLTMMPAKVVASKKTVRKVPTHMMITFVDEKTQKVELQQNEFNYSVKAEGNIKDIKVYDNERLLTEAVYHEEYNDWQVDLSKVSVGEGFTGWKYDTYYISIDNQTDDSAVASFTLDTELLQTVYGVGYQLDLSLLNINLVTEKGSKQRKEGWEACKTKGFTAEPEQGYTFTKEDAQKGTKAIQIKNNGKTQTFDVKVEDYEKQIPAKIELFSKTGEPIQTITITGENWKKSKGMYSLYDVQIPDTYQKWEKDTFTVKVYNAAEEVLSDYTVKKAIDGKALEIDFPHYTEYDSYGSYVRLFFQFSDAPVPTQPEGKLADGEWYGTATWGRYYTDKGPNVVKVTVKNGVITGAESIKYSDDTNALYANGKNILKKAVGLSDLSGLSKELTEKKGEVYDAVSAATETAKGHLSAMENAVAKAKQYGKDQKDQKVAWMEFKQKPALSVKFGTPLDLSKTELTLHLTDGGQKTVTFDQLQENGIVTDHQNGENITKETEGFKDGDLVVKFTHELSQTTLPVKISFLNEVKQKVPTHILVPMQDDKTKKIPLEDGKFRYRLETQGEIKAMAIYDNDNKLADGAFEDGYNSWKFVLKGVSAGDGYAGWKYENYFVDLDTSADESAVASFTLDTSQVPKQYAVGEALQLDQLNISLKTAKGSSQRLNGWANCRSKGFSASMENGHRFTEKEAGKQTITISVGEIQQTFQVDVKDYASQIPAKVELYDGAKDTLLKTITVEDGQWKRDKGCVTKTGIELPEAYKDWNGETFKVKVYNKESQLIADEVYKVGQDYYKEALEIDFPHYTEYYGEGGYLKMYFSFQKTTEPPAEESTATGEGSAKVGDFGYDAKVTVKYNKKTKQIVSVTDNGTEAGSNGSFWEKAVVLFEKFKGKTAKEVDSVDAISSATISSDAIKEAVKKALGEETEETEAGTETAEGSKTVGSFGYDAKVTVTFNKQTGEIISVADNGTKPDDNASFWKKAEAMFKKFKGKTAADIDSIDAVSSATISSDAIKGAVKEALASKSGAVHEPKVTAADLRTNMLFAATENALLNITTPAGAEVFYTTDGSDPTGENDVKKN